MPEPADSRLSDEAIAWLVQLKFGTVTGAAHAAWRRQSPAHEAAARRAEALWLDIGETGAAAAERRRSAPARQPRLGRRALLGGALAASLAGGIIASGVLGPSAGIFSDHTTRIGERRRIALPDGSIAFLNTSSALSVRFSAHERLLLLDAGEVLVQVAKDTGRPFFLRAGAGDARALGTVFSVRRTGRNVRVVVSEGEVLVRAPETGSVRLTAGQGVSFGENGDRVAPGPVDVAAATAWQRGKLIFHQRPLGEVVAELDRYHQGRILLADERLAGLPVTGVFDLGDREGVLRSIERALPVSISRWPLLTILR